MAMAHSTIAATSTLAMVRTAVARGFEVGDLLTASRLTPESLENPDARLPAPTVLALWNALRERTADPVLQLAAPATLPFGAYRVIDYLVAASATVGDGVRRFASFFGLIAESLTLSVEEQSDASFLCLTTQTGGAVAPVYVDYVFAALVSRIRMRIRPGLRLLRVELRQPTPPHVSPYHLVFCAPMHFGAPADRLWFTDEEWAAPTESADAALVRLLEEHARILSQRISRDTGGFVGAVRKVVGATFAKGTSAAVVARELNVSVRTLQRRLSESGTTFREVSESVRGQLAEGYLSDPKVSIAEVACLLGFSEHSAFIRAFRRWTGESPSRWRRRRSRGP